MNIGIITDSACDLPASSLQRYGIAAVPLKVVVGQEAYRDWRDLEPHTLYDWMEVQGLVAQTRPPDVEDFLAVYRRGLETYDRLVSIHVSSGLSETPSRAEAAAAMLQTEDRIHIIDSGHATAALAEVVLAAAEVAAASANPGGVIRAAQHVRDSIVVQISPGSQMWLAQNGPADRLGRRAAGLLGLRPLLAMQDGELRELGSVRRGAVVDAFINRIRSRFGDAPVRLTVALAGKDREVIKAIKRKLESSGLHISRGRVQFIGPAVSAHLGPGALVLCAYPELGAVLDI